MPSLQLDLNNGEKMPQLGLGTWMSKPGEVKAAVVHALKAGYRHIDCAFFYENEEEVGQGLKEAMQDLQLDRKDVFITSKLWNTFHHPEDVEPAFLKSLSALGLDYLDLFLIHWPTAFKRGGSLMPMDEDNTIQIDTEISNVDTWKAMEKLVEKGLVRSIGLSNFNSKQIQQILDNAKIRPVVNQVECHPYLNQEKLLKFCRERDIVLTAYSPLGSPDRPWAKPGDLQLLDDPKIKDLAAKHGKTAAQVVIRWQIQRGIVVIPKSVNPARIAENFGVFDFSLTDEEMQILHSFDRPNGRLIIPSIGGKQTLANHPDYPFHIEF